MFDWSIQTGEMSVPTINSLVHSDVCGPIQTTSIGGRRYFVMFIDDYSRCCAVYFLKKKSKVLEKFKEFESIVTNQCGQNIGCIQTNNGSEYLRRSLKNI